MVTAQLLSMCSARVNERTQYLIQISSTDFQGIEELTQVNSSESGKDKGLFSASAPGAVIQRNMVCQL